MIQGQEGRPLYTVDEIAASYDAQAEESFRVKQENAEFFEWYGRAVGRELAKLEPKSLLDAGCGDGVTLRWALEELHGMEKVWACDVSLARAKFAWSQVGHKARVGGGSLMCLPLTDGLVDVAMTSHSMEPNGGKEVDILRELKRVARRYVVLFEPDYDAAPPEGKARMERLNYVRNIREAIDTVGFTVLKDEPFSVIGNPLNPTNVWVLRK